MVCLKQPAATVCASLLFVLSNGLGQFREKEQTALVQQGRRLNHARLEYKCEDANRIQCSQCGREYPRCDYALYQDKIEGPWMPCCEKSEFIKLLGWFDDVVKPHIDINGKDFWYSIIYGSLLGSARKGDMIDWDTDIDIAVPKNRMSWLEKLLQERVADANPPYYVSASEAHGVPVVRLQMSKTNEAHIDIWDAEGLEAGEACARVGFHTSSSYKAFPLEMCPLGNSQFPCFRQKDLWLNSWYGSGWASTNSSNKENANPLPLPAECNFSNGLTSKPSTSTSLLLAGFD